MAVFQSILMVLNLVPNKMGAFEKFMMAFAQRCRQEGIQLDFLIAGEPLTEIRESLQRSHSQIHVDTAWNAGTEKEKETRFITNVCRVIREKQYDVVSFSFCNESAVIKSLLKVRIGIKNRYPKRTLWHQHSHQVAPNSLSSKYLSQLRFLSLLVDKICPVSRFAGDIMQQRSISAKKIQVLYNGVAPVVITEDERRLKREELGIGPQDFALFSASSLIPRKNVEMTIRALGKASSTCPNTHLFVAGDGSERDNLLTLAKELKLAHRVHLLGRRSDVPALIAAADLCVLTSYSEALPFFCGESYAQKRAMICTPAGAITEILENGMEGVLVPFNDADALATAISRFVNEPQYRQDREVAAFQTYQKRWTLDAMVENYFRCYIP